MSDIEQVASPVSKEALAPSESSSRDNTSPTPAVCFEDCTNASSEAQAAGKTPKLCEPGSAFRVAYQACSDCVSEDGSSLKVIDGALAQFIEYCGLGLITRTMTYTELGRAGVAATMFLPADVFVAPTMSDISVKPSALLPSSSPSAADPNSSLESTGPVESTPPGEPPDDTTSEISRVWIAGAVVGPIGILALVLLGALICLRKNRRSSNTSESSDSPTLEKAQSDSDCVRPRQTDVHQMEGPSPQPWETSANEAAAGDPPAYEEKQTE